jgi:hypothetical protein
MTDYVPEELSGEKPDWDFPGGGLTYSPLGSYLRIEPDT